MVVSTNRLIAVAITVMVTAAVLGLTVFASIQLRQSTANAIYDLFGNQVYSVDEVLDAYQDKTITGSELLELNLWLIDNDLALVVYTHNGMNYRDYTPWKQNWTWNPSGAVLPGGAYVEKAMWFGFPVRVIGGSRVATDNPDGASIGYNYINLPRPIVDVDSDGVDDGTGWNYILLERDKTAYSTRLPSLQLQQLANFIRADSSFYIRKMRDEGNNSLGLVAYVLANRR